MLILGSILAVFGILSFFFGWKPTKFVLKTLMWVFISIIAMVVVFIIYYNVAVDIKYPKVTEMPASANNNVQTDSLGFYFGKNWMQQNIAGLWEMYIEGNAMERGTAFGKLNKDLLYYQEKVFMNQIDELIPNRKYQHILKYFIRTYNRNLTDYVPEENLEEIYAMSQSCSHEFDYVGDAYDRQLNFHAAHDLGHAMQDYMLVGCTSFATWGDNSEDKDLLVGRNFDFYMGDEFAKNKLVTFVNPTTGHKFAMVGWPGMTGVCSGMNEKGLTVTINAAKSSMPTGSATPISLLARRILQYAGNIEEAKAIADSTQTFVSESLLIGSVADNCAAIIEKSVDHCALYQAPQGQQWITCANHYQSEDFKNDENNIENIKTSDSPARQKRADELIAKLSPLNPTKAATILRDKRGNEDANIGLGNELALNQLQGHHSVVFNPTKLKMWVSTTPWQEGEFVCYDLGKLFSQPEKMRGRASECEQNIAADTAFIQSTEFQNYLQYRTLSKKARKEGLTEKEIDLLVKANPNLFAAYETAGDAYLKLEKTEQAINSWKSALGLRIPKQMERERIENKIKKHTDKK